jgi:hypothetical protein
LRTNPTTAVSLPAARSPHDVCEAARLVNCGHCWAAPGAPCVPGGTGPDGFHLARLVRAYRRGLISAPALSAILQDLVVFTNATVVCDAQDGAR